MVGIDDHFVGKPTTKAMDPMYYRLEPFAPPTESSMNGAH